MADPERPSVLMQIHEYFMGLTRVGRLILVLTMAGIIGVIGFGAVQCSNRMAYDNCVDSRRAQYGIEDDNSVIGQLIMEDCRKLTEDQ